MPGESHSLLAGKEHGEAPGIIMCTISVVMQSAQMSLSGRLMSGKLDSVQLTFYTGACTLPPHHPPSSVEEVGQE